MTFVTNVRDGFIRISTEFKSIRTLINGNQPTLGGLNTTEKTTLIAAINEVNTKAGNAGASINDASTSSATVWSSTKTAAQIAALVDAAPGALDTLNELAAALGDDPNFATTLATAMNGKQPKSDDLTAISALVSAANKIPYATGAGTWAFADLTAAGRALLDDADNAAQRDTLSVYARSEIGDPTTNFVADIEAGLL